ncbi:MAG: PH domain-containing protein [Candidatus Hodarchaeales archaeon]|jgi:membrane protein YdbS with pleckstrin-like domain
MSDLPHIIGSEIPSSPPDKPRIIRPSRNFLYKNYFLFLLTAVVFIIAMIIFVFFINTLIGSSRGPTVQQQLNDIFLLMTVGFSILWLILFVIYGIGMYIYVKQMVFIVHGSEIVVKKGLINKTEKHVPYRTVTHISMRSGPFDRLFNIGTVEIQTAGGPSSSLESMAEEKLEGLIIYREVRDYILTQLRLFQLQDMEKTTFEDTTQALAPKSSDEALLETLQDIKMILSQKFQILEDKLTSISEELRNTQKY